MYRRPLAALTASAAALAAILGVVLLSACASAASESAEPAREPAVDGPHARVQGRGPEWPDSQIQRGAKDVDPAKVRRVGVVLGRLRKAGLGPDMNLSTAIEMPGAYGMGYALFFKDKIEIVIQPDSVPLDIATELKVTVQSDVNDEATARRCNRAVQVVGVPGYAHEGGIQQLGGGQTNEYPSMVCWQVTDPDKEAPYLLCTVYGFGVPVERLLKIAEAVTP